MCLLNKSVYDCMYIFPPNRPSSRRSGARLRSTSEASEEDLMKHLPTPSQPLTVTEVAHPPPAPGGQDIVELRPPPVLNSSSTQPPAITVLPSSSNGESL